MFTIKEIKARQILDSRGNPTIEVDLTLLSGSVGRASVPSGASVGSKEYVELRDNDYSHYMGKGVLKAIENINTKITPKIMNRLFESQQELDLTLIKLDGTKTKSNLGANAILAISIAFAKAAALQMKLHLFQFINGDKYSLRLPIPMLNVINGGVHADNNIDIQEFMIVPYADSFARAMEMASLVFHRLKENLKKLGFSTNVGDEGGFAPDLGSTEKVLDILSETIEKTGLSLGTDIKLALDIAANEILVDNKYYFKNQNTYYNSEQMVLYYEKLIKSYHICSIEDPMAENDLEGWRLITSSIGNIVQIVGDDLFVTNTEIFSSGIKKGLANSILIKMNQIGTLTETLEAIDVAYQNNYDVIVSHRSGETEDTTIAHLAVGVGSKYIKAGSICRTERVCKYNEILRIAELI